MYYYEQDGKEHLEISSADEAIWYDYTKHGKIDYNLIEERIEVSIIFADKNGNEVTPSELEKAYLEEQNEKGEEF